MRGTARQPASTAEFHTTASSEVSERTKVEADGTAGPGRSRAVPGTSQQTEPSSPLASEHENMDLDNHAIICEIEGHQAAYHEAAADPNPGPERPSSPTQCNELQLELEKDPEENIWDNDTCLLCSKTFANVGGRTKHYRMTHNAYKPYECDACGNKFCQLFQLKRHITLHTNLASSTTFDCKRCYMVFFVEDNLTRHQCTFRKDLWKCPECGTDVPDQDFDDVLAHIRAHITK